MKLTQKKLKEILHYNPALGMWTWKKRLATRIRIGDVAGNVCKTQNYRIIGIYGKTYRSCRLAFLYMLGYFPEHDAEHRNRIRQDDRWENLREATRSCNMRNTGNLNTNTSGVKGIDWHKALKKWRSRIFVIGKEKPLGCYKDFSEAVLARLAGEQCVNWAGCDSSSPAYQYAIENRLIKK